MNVVHEHFAGQLIDQHTKDNPGPMVSVFSSKKSLQTNISFRYGLYHQVFHTQFDGGFQLAFLQLLDEVKQVVIEILWVVLLALLVQCVVLHQPLLSDFVGNGYYEICPHKVVRSRVEKASRNEERIVEFAIEFIPDAVGQFLDQLGLHFPIPVNLLLPHLLEVALNLALGLLLDHVVLHHVGHY